MERLLSTTKAGEALGGLHRNDVCRLIRDGKLTAKKLVVRGRGGKPRYAAPQSSIDQFIREMPDAKGDARPVRRAPRRGNLRDVIEFV